MAKSIHIITTYWLAKKEWNEGRIEQNKEISIFKKAKSRDYSLRRQISGSIRALTGISHFLCKDVIRRKVGYLY